MGAFDVIASASETLRARLAAGLAVIGGPAPVVRLDDLTADIPRDPPIVTLFLYDIAEEATVRNRPRPTDVVAGQLVSRKPPLGLRLMYMVTAWAGDRPTEQLLLGRVLQTLHDDSILAGTDLAGTLAGTSAELRVSLAPLTLEDRARVWFAISKPYRLSVNYELRVTNIDATSTATAPAITERTARIGVPA